MTSADTPPVDPEKIAQLKTIGEINAAQKSAVAILQQAQTDAAARGQPAEVIKLQLKELEVDRAALKAGMNSAEMAAALAVIKAQTAKMTATAGNLPTTANVVSTVATLLGQANGLISTIQKGVTG